MIKKAKDLIKALQEMVDLHGEDVDLVLKDNNGEYCWVDEVFDVDREEDDLADALFGGKTFVEITSGYYI